MPWTESGKRKEPEIVPPGFAKWHERLGFRLLSAVDASGRLIHRHPLHLVPSLRDPPHAKEWRKWRESFHFPVCRSIRRFRLEHKSTFPRAKDSTYSSPRSPKIGPNLGSFPPQGGCSLGGVGPGVVSQGEWRARGGRRWGR